MFIVYVKHYLTEKGIEFFKREWFPLVYAIMSRQQGFIAFTYEIQCDCVNLFLKFENRALFSAWFADPAHTEVIRALDIYRSRGYWEAVNTEDEHANLSTLAWEHNTVSSMPGF